MLNKPQVVYNDFLFNQTMYLKHTIKRIIGRKFYSFIRWYYHIFGIIYIPVGIYRYLKNKNLVCVSIQGTNGKVYIRPATTDMDVYNEIFIKRELDINFEKPEYIIDGGAHIGFSAIWFSIYYPGAKILAIEPEMTNFELLKKNTQLYPNIICINAGLWSHITLLEIQKKDVDNWNFTVKETEIKNINSIQSITIPELIKRYNWSNIDILKLDIEGSEIEVMNCSNEWIDSVKMIVIELHDRFRPGCETALSNAIMNSSFVSETIGEKHLLRNTMSLPFIQS